MKYSFYNDYSEGAHPQILDTLRDTNEVQQAGYGKDSYSLSAEALIKEQLNSPDVDVHFVSGGTQANLLVLGSILKPFESVIAVNTAHIAVHEAGAIEATGHKINTVESSDGKITSFQIRDIVSLHNDEHMVKPRVIFISNSTEVGTIYLKSELEEVSATCRELGLYLYLDGARLGSALASTNSDLTLQDVARLVDVFYIGGTKNGALLGEAIVIASKNLQEDFRFHMKQRGALLAKGRVVGIQFQELFRENLFFDLARHANEMAEKLAIGIKDLGYQFLSESSTNQIFPILPVSVIETLSKDYGFYVWAKVDDNSSAIRLVTSWATPVEQIDNFLTDLKNCS